MPDSVEFTYVGPKEDGYNFQTGEIGFTGYYDESHALNLVAKAPQSPNRPQAPWACLRWLGSACGSDASKPPCLGVASAETDACPRWSLRPPLQVINHSINRETPLAATRVGLLAACSAHKYLQYCMQAQSVFFFDFSAVGGLPFKQENPVC